MSKNKQFSDGHNNSKYPDSCSSCGGRTGMDHLRVTNEEGTKTYHNNLICPPPSQRPHGEFEDKYEWMNTGPKKPPKNYPPKNDGPKKPPKNYPPAGGVLPKKPPKNYPPKNDWPKKPPKDNPPAGGVLPKKPKPKGPTPVGATVSRNKKQATGPYATS